MVKSLTISLLAIYLIATGFASEEIDHFAPNDEVTCTEDGFLPHPKNCREFYWCSLRRRVSRAIILECEENQIFDTATQNCTFPWMSTRRECGGTLNIANEVEENLPVQEAVRFRSIEHICVQEGFLQDENDCSKFYRCVDVGNGKLTKYEFECVSGTIWDPEISGCNHPWATKNVRCGGRNDVSTTEQNYYENEDYADNPNPIYKPYPSEIPPSNSGYPAQMPIDHPHEPNNEILPQQNPTDNEVNNFVETSDNECRQEGFIGDSKDCKKFYRCVTNGKGYTKYEFNCGEGTVWDSEISSCNHEWAVKNNNCRKGGTGEQINENLEPNESTSVPSTNLSSENPQLEISEPNTSSESINNEISTEHPSSSITPIESSSPEESSTQTSPSKSTECEQEGFVGDSQNCKKFYRCVDNGKGGFTKYEFSCGEGTIWDSEQLTCNYPSAVKTKCGNVSPGSTTTKPDVSSSSEANPEYNFTPESTTNQEITSKPEETSTETENTDSTTPLPCATQETTTLSSNESSSEAISTDSSPSSTETSQQSSTQSTDSGKDDQKLSDECKKEGFFGNTKDCKKFYRCVNNGQGGLIKYEFSCGEGTVWDSDLETCNYPHAVKNKCDNAGSTSKPSTEEPEDQTTDSKTTTQYITESQTEAQTTQSHLVETTTGSEQIDGSTSTESSTENKTDSTESETISQTENQTEVSTTMQTQEPTTETNQILTTSGQSEKTETPPSQTEATTSPPKVTTDGSNAQLVDNKCTQEGFIPDMNDCKKFIRCVSNGNGFTKYEFSCGPGTIWDPDLLTCNHPYAVKNKKCEQSGTTTGGEEGNNESEKPPPEETTKPSDSQNDKCTEEGFHPSKTDCKKFFRCVSNGQGGFTKYDFTCGEGTIWDPNLVTCNYPSGTENKACGHSAGKPPETSSTTENIPSETTTTEIDTETSSPEFSTTSEPDSTTVTESQTTESNQESTTPFVFCNQTTNTPEETTTDTQGTTLSSTEQLENTTTLSPETTEATEATTTNEQESTISTTETEQFTTESTEEPITNTQEATVSTTEREQSTTELTGETTTNTQETTVSTTETEQSTTESTEETITNTQETTVSTTETEQSTTESTEETITNTQETTVSTTEAEQSITEPTEEPTTNTQESTLSTTELEQTTTEQQKSTTTIPPETTEIIEETTTDLNQSSIPTTESTIQTTSETEAYTDENTDSTTDSSSTTQSPESNQTAVCPLGELEGDQISLICPTGFKRHPKYCNLFYQCTNNAETMEIKILVLRCPNGTIYNDQKMQCLPPEESSQSCTGQIADKPQLRTTASLPMEIDLRKPLCPYEGTFAVDSLKCLNNFIKCQRAPIENGSIRGYVHQCPNNYVYWPISRKCEKQSPALGCRDENPLPEQSRWMIPVEVLKI